MYLNRRTAETLEAMATALFQSWFVDFEPARARMHGEPEEEICRRLGLAPELLRLFPDNLDTSDHDVTSHGWPAATLDTVAGLSTASITPAATPTQLFEHYSIPAFDAGRQPIAEHGSAIKSNKYKVSPSAVLVSKLNPATPRVWLPHVRSSHAISSTEFMQFLPHAEHDRTFLYLLFNSAPIQAAIEERVTGSTGSRQRAQPGEVARLPIVLPPPAIRTAFDRTCGPMLARATSLREQCEELRRLRNTLLPELLTGRIRTEDELYGHGDASF
jgi:type I restriction enzyme S subunit